MAIDPSKFQLINILDTCAVWNILSSKILYSIAKDAKCDFSITEYVKYECLFKRRKTISKKQNDLMDSLRQKQDNGDFRSFYLSIEDLQNVSILEKRRNLGKGELSSIAYSMKINKAFLTDDRKARRFAEDILGKERVQTTPHLFGWLAYKSLILDNDKDGIIAEHVSCERPLKKDFEKMFYTALEYRLRS